MLIGEFRHQLDDKNRIRIPAKLRNQLGNDYIVMKGTNGCLFIFSQEEIENTLNSKLRELPLGDLKAQKSLRALFSSGYNIEEDSQGRFVLPNYLKEYAGIKKNVVSVGVGNRVELWDEEVWDNYNGDVNIDDVIGELTRYGI